jgi:F420-dependent oxidoreductase-like protein
MDLSIFTEPQEGASYDDLLRVARAAEDLGFDAFFRSDHYLKTDDGSGLPGPTDAWLTLAGLARETSRIRLGTLVSPVTFRLPGALAIAVAQVDQMSGGRVELGLGAGWFAGEHAAYGIPFPEVAERFDRLSEQVEIIDGLLTTAPGATYSFAGAHYQLADSPGLPKPVQSPRPPIIMGGAGKKRSAALAARFADEFNVGGVSVQETATVFGRVGAAVAAAGREIRYSITQTVCVGRNDVELTRRATKIGKTADDLRANALAGTPDQVVEKLAAFAAVGATRAYLQVLDLADLDQLELIAAQILPHV